MQDPYLIELYIEFIKAWIVILALILIMKCIYP